MCHGNGELLDTLRVFGRFGYIHHAVCCPLDLLGRKTLVKMLALNGNVLSNSANWFGASAKQRPLDACIFFCLVSVLACYPC